jgi:hypothetical protein
MRFASETLFGVDTLWPYENQIGPPKGTYVGLMQDQLVAVGKHIATTEMSTAFNWIANANTGYAIFSQKVAAVDKLQNNAHKANPAVPCPTCQGSLAQEQIEEMALFQYGGFLPPGRRSNVLPSQLLTPQCVGGSNNGASCNSGCTCAWQVNPSKSNLVSSGECYVCAVYGATNTPPFCPCH